MQSHTGIGDPNWIMAGSLWEVVTDEPSASPEQQAPEQVAPEQQVGEWNPTGSYSTGDRVTFQGSTFEAVQSHTGNGDPNWIYAPSLWKSA